jgi:hypothetical protein
MSPQTHLQRQKRRLLGVVGLAEELLLAEEARRVVVQQGVADGAPQAVGVPRPGEGRSS